MEPITVFLLLCAATLVLMLLVSAASVRMALSARRRYPTVTLRGRIILPRKLKALLTAAARSTDQDLFTLEVQSELPTLRENLHALRRHLRMLPCLQRSRDGASTLLQSAQQMVATSVFSPDVLCHAIPRDADPAHRELFPWLVMSMQVHQLHQALSRRRPYTDADAALVVKHTSSMLSRLLPLNWPLLLEEDDPLHQLLLQDPSGIYPLMDATSRRHVRKSAAALAHSIRSSPVSLCQKALELSQCASAGEDERMVQWYLTHPRGQRALCRHMPGWYGMIITLLQPLLSVQALRTLLFIGLSFIFLHAGYPLLLLPCLLIMLRSVPRLRQQQPPAAPAMNQPHIPERCRTLLVLPRVLQSPQEALSAVREISMLLHTCGQQHVDVLLMGDSAPARFAHMPDDNLVIAAATAALSALADSFPDTHLLYLQRQRVPHAADYRAPGGSYGAIRTVCQLIASGDCSTPICHASFDPASLHRHYAFVMAIQEGMQPVPGALEALIRAAAHPMHSRRPSEDGYTGSSIFLPGILSDDASGVQCDMDFSGTGLIRPDAFLEATDGLVDASSPSCFLIAGVLSGVTACQDALMIPPSAHHPDIPAAHLSALRWQLPLVKTPSGMIPNPMRHTTRRRLRRRLYDLLIPMAQWVLMLHAGMHRDLLLIAVSLLPDLLRMLRLPGWLRHVAGLPGRTAAILLWPLKSLRLQGRPLFPALQQESEAHQTLALWAQLLSTVWMLAFALSATPIFLPGLIIALLFGAYPFLPETTDAEPDTPTQDAKALRDTATALWHDLCTAALNDQHMLPPDAAVTDADSAFTSPATIAGAILACISARELQLITAGEACTDIRRITDSLMRLPLAYGLPCRRWHVHSLAIADGGVSASACGLLKAALFTAAQAVRCWLPELPMDHLELPSVLEEAAASIRTERLLDASTGLFFRDLTPDGVGESLCRTADDTAGLLYVCGILQRELPPAILHRLNRSTAEKESPPVPTDETGVTRLNAAALFLPEAPVLTDHINDLTPQPGSTLNQCLRLAAIAHRVCSRPLLRYFTMLPSVHATLPLLQLWPTRVHPVPHPVREAAAPQQPCPALDPLSHPVSAFIAGDRHTSIAVSSLGSARFRLGGQDVCPFSGDAAHTEGPQTVLMDEGRVFRLTDPLLLGSTTILGGELCFTRTCGSIRSTLSFLVDPEAGQLIQEVTLVNLTNHERTLCVLNVLPAGRESAIRVTRPSVSHVELALSDQRIIHHSFHASGAVHASVVAELDRLTGPDGSLRHIKPAGDECLPLSAHPDCAAFQLRTALHGRSRITIAFRTALTPPDDTAGMDLSALRRFIAARYASYLASLRLRADQLAAFCGAVFWHGQAHQHADASAVPCVLLDHDEPQDTSVLTELLHLSAFMDQTGFPFRIAIRCADGIDKPELPDEAAGAVMWLAENEPDPSYHLRLYSSRGDVATQLAAMRCTLPQLRAASPATPGKSDVAHYSGGSDPETGDYVLQLPPGQQPQHWPLRLSSPLMHTFPRLWQLDQSMQERPLLELPGGSVLDPFSALYQRSIRISAAFVRWECCAQAVTLQLTAFCAPSSAMELRRLRVLNQTDTPIDATLHLVAHPAALPSPVPSLQGQSALWAYPSGTRCVAGADEEWQLMRTSRLAAYGYGDHHTSLPQLDNGTALHMTRRLRIPAHGSADAAWMSGTLPPGAAPDGWFEMLKDGGISGLLRRVRELALHRPQSISVACRDTATELLFNHILPRQMLHAAPSCSGALAVQSFADPDAAVTLLNAVLFHEGDKLPSLLAAARWHAMLTGSDELLRKHQEHAGHSVDIPSGHQTLLHVLPHLVEAIASRPGGAEENPHHPDRLLAQLLRQLMASDHDAAWLTLHTLNPANRSCTDPLPPYMVCMKQEGRIVPCDDAAGWLWCIMLESLFGVIIRQGTLRLEPHLPSSCHSLHLTLQWGASTWHISCESTTDELLLDGDPVPDGVITLTDDGRIHQVRAPIQP